MGERKLSKLNSTVYANCQAFENDLNDDFFWGGEVQILARNHVIQRFSQGKSSVDYNQLSLYTICNDLASMGGKNSLLKSKVNRAPLSSTHM